MLKRLRIKFVALNLACVALVLVAVCATICALNYQNDVDRVQTALDGTISHALDPHQKPHGGRGDFNPSFSVGADALLGDGNSSSNALDGEFDALGDANGNANGDESFQGRPLEIGDLGDGKGPGIPVAVYALLDSSVLVPLPSLTTASISEATLTQAVKEAAEAADGFGTLSNVGLAYQKRTVDSVTYLAFTDASYLSGWQSLAVTLAAACVGALLVFLVISIFFARWALRPVARAWEQQRRFVADASHDLKTPLTVILANTSILLEHPERSVASQSQWVESTQHEVEQMQGLVNDLLLLAKLDEEEAQGGAGALGGSQAVLEPVDLSDLVEGELLQFESVAFERDVALESAIAPAIEVHADAARLRRVVDTLLDNACKYTHEGERVDVTLSAGERSAVLTVRNTGSIIAPEDLPHVFDRFYRADKARTRDDSGHGLGLAIAHAITEEHNGTLTVASNETAGTTFTLTLPMA